MVAVRSGAFISEDLPDAVSTTVDARSPITRDTLQSRSLREAWEEVIDRQLIEWGSNPGRIVDEGVTAPNEEAIRKSVQWVRACRENGNPPPDSVVVDPNGGIVFERREQDVTEVMHFWDDGTVEYRRFRGVQLVERRSL